MTDDIPMNLPQPGQRIPLHCNKLSDCREEKQTNKQTNTQTLGQMRRERERRVDGKVSVDAVVYALCLFSLAPLATVKCIKVNVRKTLT